MLSADAEHVLDKVCHLCFTQSGEELKSSIDC